MYCQILALNGIVSVAIGSAGQVGFTMRGGLRNSKHPVTSEIPRLSCTSPYIDSLEERPPTWYRYPFSPCSLGGGLGSGRESMIDQILRFLSAVEDRGISSVESKAIDCVYDLVWK